MKLKLLFIIIFCITLSLFFCLCYGENKDIKGGKSGDKSDDKYNRLLTILKKEKNINVVKNDINEYLDEIMNN